MAINFSASFAACLAAGIKVPRQFMYCIAQDTGAPYVLYKDSGGGAGGDWGEFPQSPEPSLQPSPSPPYHNSPGQQQQQPPQQQPGQPQQQPPQQQQGPPLPPQQNNFNTTPNRALTPHRPPTSLVHPGPVEDDVQQQSQSQQQAQQPPPPQQQPPPPQPPQQQQQSTQTPQPNPPQPTPQQELGVGCDLSQSYYGGGRGTQHMLSQGFMSYLKQPVVLTSLNPNDPVPDYTGFHMTTGMPDLLSGSLKASPVSGVTGVKSELRLFKCLTCGKDFKQKSTLLQHERIHTDSRPYGCSECGKRFRQQSHLTQHLRIHANEKPFACIYCERTFRQRAILNQHLRIHSDVSPHLVYKNGQLWPQDVPFPQDKEQNQGFDLQPDSQCFSPDSQFPAYFKDSKGGLLTGVAHGVFGTGNGKTLPEMIQSGRNAGLPLYVRCPICQKEFKQKSTLLQHGCIHIESRPYPCGECGKRFRQQSHLTQHLRIHTNEKPYGCLYCGRNFRQRTILNQHVRIHTGEKPYKCAQCGKDFRQKAILDQHTRTHQGDRPYCCPLPNCRRRFAAESEVKRHVENHVGPKRKPPPPGVSMNPTPLVKPELYLPQCYPHPGNFQQQYTMSQLLGSPPQPTALVQ
ncbi:uncharacterized protein [Halyomorpha halys]|uniref:uncharacterized protein isoform X1 n=1 Tax=Halyomorpha halys TaxID=286706 RepID=UPI0006D50992|nr:zinc finger protein 629-like isoform X1 [Halyomorpha halys]XP_014273908.1 zinc finger protein 629-like isoform X1 [Halyomorpha halys]